jgi:hypothetical protein
MPTYRGQEVTSVEHDRKRGVYALIDVAGEILAELKQHEFLSQPQLRKVKLSNGRHRRAGAQVHRGSAGITHLTWPSRTVYLAPSAWTWFGADFATPEPAIENAGIRAGEITALRGWRVRGSSLFSIYRRGHEWFPGEPVAGDPDKRDQGVHAFKDDASLKEYVWMYQIQERMERAAFYGDGGSSVFALGAVHLWGDVVEHERGYRAQYAKVARIDRVTGTGPNDSAASAALLLHALRLRYGVGGGDITSTPTEAP